MIADTSKPGLEERYIGATNSSDLTLSPDGNCDATHLIVAGLLGNRMGEALVHLRAEWDGADKPRKATEDEIHARAGELPKRKDKPDLKRARTDMLVAYSVAMRHRAHRLSGWLPALTIVAEWAHVKGVDTDLLSPALYHFLNPTCPVCDGLGQRRMDDAPVLGKQCHHCNGTGSWPRPLGADRVQDWLKSCAGKARRDRGGLIRGEIEPATMEVRLRGFDIGRESTPEEDAKFAAAFKASMERNRR